MKILQLLSIPNKKQHFFSYQHTMLTNMLIIHIDLIVLLIIFAESSLIVKRCNFKLKIINMTKKRDTFNYNLKDGKKVVYKGTTNDLGKRAKQHEADGKKFTHIQQVGRAKTEQGASKEETRQLKVYQANSGKNPKYNKTNNG